MSLQEHITVKLAEHFQADYIEVINESNQHNVPAGSESHFKVILASQKFEGLMHVARHRLVHDLLKDELANQIHALSLKLYSPGEWKEQKNNVPDSPPCLGGSKHDKT